MLPQTMGLETQRGVSQKELLQERSYNEIDLCRMARDGVIERDQNGYFTHEQEMSMFGEEMVGDKFYIEDMYRAIETRIIRLSSESELIRSQSKEISGFLPVQLLVLDYQLDVLYQLLRGQAEPVLMSPRQIEEYLQDQMTLGGFAEFLAGGGQGTLGAARAFCSFVEHSLNQI